MQHNFETRPAIGTATLKELPQLRFDKPELTVGVTYPIVDKDGSNFWIVANDGTTTSIGSCRFENVVLD